MDVARVLDKGVDYIREVCHINPFQYSYTTIKRFAACLQMLSPLFSPWQDSDPVSWMWFGREIEFYRGLFKGYWAQTEDKIQLKLEGIIYSGLFWTQYEK